MRICNYSGIERGRFQLNHGHTKGCRSGAVINYRVRSKKHSAGAVSSVMITPEVAAQVSQRLAAKLFRLV